MKEKNYNLELVRMVSFVLVIVIHVTNYFCRAYGEISRGEYLFSLVLDTAARVSVPCFFMISGALLLGRDEPLQKHARRLFRFLSVLIVWSVVYYFWNTYYMGTSYDLKEIFSVPVEQHLWYLYAMIPIYLVLPFFQILCRGMSMKLEKVFLAVTTSAVLINYLLGLGGQELYYDVPLVGDRCYVYYIFMGYYLYKYRRHIPLGQKPVLAVCLLSLAADVGITLGVTVSQGDHYEGALTYETLFIILASVTFFLFMLRLGNGRIRFGERARKVIGLFCACSFGIYLIHILFLDCYKKYVEAADLSAWIAVPVLTVGIAGLSFAFVWVMRRFVLGRKIT